MLQYMGCQQDEFEIGTQEKNAKSLALDDEFVASEVESYTKPSTENIEIDTSQDFFASKLEEDGTASFVVVDNQ